MSMDKQIKKLHLKLHLKIVKYTLKVETVTVNEG